MRVRTGTTLIALLATLTASCVPQGPEDLKGTAYDTTPSQVRHVDPDTTSLEIIADTSGSMEGRKMEDMKAALYGVLEELQGYARENRLEVGLIHYPGSRAEVLVPLQNFDYVTFRDAVESLDASSGTPLGLSLALGERELDEKSSGKRNLLLLTDGQNSRGYDPDTVLASINATNQEYGDSPTRLAIVAFETPVEYFSPLQEQGALVREASGAVELAGTLLGTVRLMLEAPDPAAQAPSEPPNIYE